MIYAIFYMAPYVKNAKQQHKPASVAADHVSVVVLEVADAPRHASFVGIDFSVASSIIADDSVRAAAVVVSGILRRTGITARPLARRVGGRHAMGTPSHTNFLDVHKCCEGLS